MEKLRYITALILLLGMQHTFGQVKSKTKDAASLFNKATNCVLRYYYYPNIEAYFDTQKKIYYYKENGEWQTAEEIPDGYRGYSMYNKYSVFVTDYDDDNITQFVTIHKKRYPFITRENAKQLTLASE